MKNLNRLNRTVKTFAVGALILMLSISCSTDNSTPNWEDFFTAPSEEEFANVRKDALNKRTQTEIFDAEEGIEFTSDNGTKLTIHPGCLMKDGESVEGEVELSFVELYDRMDMVTTNKPLMGINADGEKEPLITGGAFYINVTQNGEDLDSGCMFNLKVPADLTGGADDDMILWNGIIDENGDLAWDDMNNPVVQDTIGTGGENELFNEELDGVETYFVFLSSFGWTNIDRFIIDDRPKTQMKVVVPEGFDHKNSAVYLSYDGEPQALAQLDRFAAEEGYFTEHYGYIPIGLDVHIVFVTAEGDNWRAGILPITIEEDETYVFQLENTGVVTEDELTDILNDLP